VNCKIGVRIEKCEVARKKGKNCEAGKQRPGGTNQSGALMLIRTSCDSSWRVRFLLMLVLVLGLGLFLRLGLGLGDEDGGMWMREPYLVYGLS
jgi:hypothetical protein